MITGKPPRGIHNNNPGNIRKTTTEWRGEIQGDDPEFETFATPEDGIRALAKILLNYQRKYGLKTVRQMISRWAPPTENNTESYINAVAAKMGVGPDNPFVLDGMLLVLMVDSIIRHENGQNPYPPETVRAGVTAALEA